MDCRKGVFSDRKSVLYIEKLSELSKNIKSECIALFHLAIQMIVWFVRNLNSAVSGFINGIENWVESSLSVE